MKVVLLVALKVVFSAGMVIGVTCTAERVSARLAGVLIGFPLGVGLTLLFLGLEQGPVFAAESSLWSMPGILAALGFCWCYRQIAMRLPEQTWAALGCCCLAGLAGYCASAVALRLCLPRNAAVRTVLVLLLLGALAGIFRRNSSQKIKRTIAITWPMLAARAGFAAVVILIVTGIAAWIGPAWSGLLAAFPTAILPSVMVLHFHYGREGVAALFRDTPLAMLAIVIFSVAVFWTFPRFGAIGGTILSYGAALIYLALYELRLRMLLDRVLPS